MKVAVRSAAEQPVGELPMPCNAPHCSTHREAFRLTAGSGGDSRSEILACPGGGKVAKRRSPLHRVGGVAKPLDSLTYLGPASVLDCAGPHLPISNGPVSEVDLIAPTLDCGRDQPLDFRFPLAPLIDGHYGSSESFLTHDHLSLPTSLEMKSGNGTAPHKRRLNTDPRTPLASFSNDAQQLSAQ
jgi:hypothetical protein